MKKIFLFGILTAASIVSVHAQWFRVWQDGESTRYALHEAATIPYTAAGSTLTIGEDTYSTSEIDSITIVYPITITWSEDGASVDIPESVDGVTATINGGNIIINNVDTCSEREFILQGSSSAGSLVYHGAYKTKFHLKGVNLTSVDSLALDIECGKRIDLIIEDGTENSLTDAANGSHTAAFYCKGHMEIGGGGSLTVTGNSKHALATKEYLFLKKTVGTITIAKAVGDGIHCGEYFKMNGGTLVLNNIGADGIQVETKANTDEELNGQFIMNNGSINITMATADTKGIRLDQNEKDTSIIPQMYLNGGTIEVTMAEKATDSKAIASDGHMTIGDGQSSPNITIHMNAVGYKVQISQNTFEKIRSTGLKVGKSDDDDDYGSTGNFLMQGGTVIINATGNYSRGMNTNNFKATGGSLSVIAPITGTDIQGVKYAGTCEGKSYVHLKYCLWKEPKED